MNKKTEIFLFAIILIIASLLRLFDLNRVPIALSGDEVDMGYQAYSILNTAKSYTGQFLPLLFSSFSEFRLPVFIYTLVPFIKIFGLNELGVRIPSAFFGILDICLIYFLIKQISNKELALISAFLFAIMPWHIQFSRIGYEATLLQAILLFATLLFIKGLRNGKLLFVSAILFVLSLYTYSTANIFSPLLIIFLVLIYKKEFFSVPKKWIILFFVIIFIISIPLVKNILSGEATGRFGAINIFSNQTIIDSVVTKRTEGELERLFHNKPLAYGAKISTNYLTTFSPQFLFLDGDPNPRHSVGGMGELYLVLLPFLLAGLFISIKHFNEKPNSLFLSWLFISPIPSSLTYDGGSHAIRLFLMFPPLVYFMAIGIYSIAKIANKKVRYTLIFVSSLILSFAFVIYLDQYYVHYSQESWRYWQYGYKESSNYIHEHQSSYDQVLINNKRDPSLSKFLFWAKIDPSYVQKEFSSDKTQKEILPGFDGFRLGKYYFGYPAGDLQPLLGSSRLYMAFQGDEIPGDWNWAKNPPQGVNPLKVINAPFSNDPYIYLLTGILK